MSTVNVGALYSAGSISVSDLILRVESALKVAGEDAMIDGAHHKQWVIDQMVRNLTGCPPEDRQSRFPDVHGRHYTFEGLGESEEYRAFVGDEEWDEGIAP